MADINELLKFIDKKILSKDEEIRLGKIIQSPTSTQKEKQFAINTFVLKNIYLVLKFAHKYKRKEFEFEDTVCYGIMGLFTAAKKFNPSCYTNRFASYARHWIKDSIMKASREYTGLPKIPVYLAKNLWSVARILSKQSDCDDATLAKLAKISEEDAHYLRTLLFKAVEFENIHGEVDSNTPEDIYAKKERINLLVFQLKKLLTPTEFYVIVHTFGLEDLGFHKMTFIEIEQTYNIVNARHLKITAIKKLKSSDILKMLYEENYG